MTRWLWLMALVGGCAPAVPALLGSSPTPTHRSDVAVGGAARVPVGQLREGSESGFSDLTAGGVTPVALYRYGIADDWDMGVMVAGTNVRLEAHGEKVVKEGSTRSTQVLGAALELGWLPETREGGGGAFRLGAEVPIAYAIDFGGVYDAWVGVRAGFEHLRGDVLFGDTKASLSATAIRVGPTIGLGAGFRRFMVLIEATLFYEGWFGDHGGEDIGRHGVVVVPGFALRMRL